MRVNRGVQWGVGPADKNKKTGGNNFQTPVAPATMMPMNPQPLVSSIGFSLV